MNTSTCGGDNDPASLACIFVVIPNLVKGALYLVGVTTVILVIIAGTKFITSGGDPKQVEGAKKTLTYAITGLAVVLFSFMIINVVAYVTGVDCIANLTSFDACK